MDEPEEDEPEEEDDDPDELDAEEVEDAEDELDDDDALGELELLPDELEDTEDVDDEDGNEEDDALEGDDDEESASGLVGEAQSASSPLAPMPDSSNKNLRRSANRSSLFSVSFMWDIPCPVCFSVWRPAPLVRRT